MNPVRVMSLFLVLLALPDSAAAQQDRFLTTLPALYRSLAGTYGDEGREIAAHVETLSQALAEWDAEFGVAERRLRAGTKADPTSAVDAHTSLAELYAARSRFRDAVREIDEAIGLNPRVTSLYPYKALLQQALGNPTEAADTFRAGWLLDPADPRNAYWLVVQRSARTTDAEIEQALGTLSAVERELVRGQRRRADSPFLSVTPLNDDVGRAMPFAPAGYARPFALLLNGEFTEGMAALKAAVAADPLVADPAVRLEAMPRSAAALRQGSVADAIALLETVASQAPGSSEAHRMLGTAHTVNGDTAEGIRHLRLAVQANPRNERAWLTLARTLEGIDSVADAVQALRDAIAAVPDAGAVRWLLSTLSPRLQRSDETDVELIAVADRLVLLAGKGELYGRVAELAQSHLDYDRAIELLEKRVALTPNSAAAHHALGSAYIDHGRESAGYAELVIALLLDPDDIDALAALGRVHLAAGRYSAAAEALERVAAIRPTEHDVLRALGAALIQLGRTAEGDARLEESARALAAAVEDQRRRRTFGMLASQATLSMGRGEFELAIALWRQVIELDRSNAGHHIRLADALVRAKRLAEAEASLRTAIMLGGGPEPHRRLAEVLAALGRSEESARERQIYRDQRLQDLRARPGAGR